MRSSRMLRVLAATASAICMFWAAVWLTFAVLALMMPLFRSGGGSWGLVGMALVFAAFGATGFVGMWAIDRATRGRRSPTQAPKGFDVLPPAAPSKEPIS